MSSDPWLIQSTTQNIEIAKSCDVGELEGIEKDKLEFEDNFEPPTIINFGANQNQKSTATRNAHEPLPDSAAYLQGLERKLKNLKKNSKLLEALGEKRQDCLRSLLDDKSLNFVGAGENNNEIFELETPVNNGESAVQEIYRYLQPVQPVTVGETVRIVEYDQLDTPHENLAEDSSDSSSCSNVSSSSAEEAKIEQNH